MLLLLSAIHSAPKSCQAKSRIKTTAEEYERQEQQKGRKHTPTKTGAAGEKLLLPVFSTSVIKWEDLPLLHSGRSFISRRGFKRGEEGCVAGVTATVVV